MDQICRAGRGTLGGGLVKCMITDTRTSDDTAICDRVTALGQVQHAKSRAQGRAQVDDFERRYSIAQASMLTMQVECTDLEEKVEDISSACKEAALQFDRARGTLDKFQAQAQHFFNQGK